MQLGGRNGDAAEFRLDANVICGAVMDGEWTDGDHASLFVNPWQLFEPRTQFISTQPSGTNTTIIVPTGPWR
jgi:hypothetical protein